MKKLLVYSWGGFTDSQLLLVLKKLNIDYVSYTRKLADYHRDMQAAQELINLVHQKKVDGIFSYNYIPLLSMVAGTVRVPYICWVYDCPHYTLFSETISSEWNYIFCFDEVMANELSARGIRHVFHFPLGVDVQDMESRISSMKKEKLVDYVCEVSFVGSFYNNQQNRLRYATFSEYTRGYLEGIIEAQLLVYGAHFIPQMLLPDVLGELVESCQLSLGAGYRYEEKELAAGMVDKEITARERERILAAVAAKHQLHVYTASEIPETVRKQPGFDFKGFADVRTQMPVVFNRSKINLNISLKSITSGIPQRVLDILACGGFCLTNYQPEIAAFFQEDKELVMYSSIEELYRKLDYYLSHEEERQAIAAKGREKVKETFELELRLKELLWLVEATKH
ncbi:MAG: glycosyltransferase [Lachnospiraceae bacterium]